MPAKQSADARRQQWLFEKERRELQRALPKAVRAAAKNSGWRTSQGVLFREFNGWFLQVWGTPWVIEAKTPARLHCKPMGLDPIFWGLTDLENNNNQPLSFRAFGAFTCRTPALREIETVEETGSSQHIAENLLDWANEQLQSLDGVLTLDAFVGFIRTHPDQLERLSYLAPLICGMLLQEKYEDALALCKEIKAQHGGGIFYGGGGFAFNINGKHSSFTDLAIEQISSRLKARLIH